MPDVRPTLFGEPSDRLAVKVCGLTRLQDACLAWELGAAALGFIFHPSSPRFLSPERARELRQRLPPEACCVGVFVDRAPGEVVRVAAFVGLEGVQLHGFEPETAIAAAACPVLKVVRSEAEALACPAPRVLLDASLPGVLGGTGLRADWNLAARIAAQRPLVLAGGIGPANVLEAMEAVRPVALDVNSAVEASPGIKDSGRLRELFARVERTSLQPTS